MRNPSAYKLDWERCDAIQLLGESLNKRRTRRDGSSIVTREHCTVLLLQKSSILWCASSYLRIFKSFNNPLLLYSPWNNYDNLVQFIIPLLLLRRWWVHLAASIAVEDTKWTAATSAIKKISFFRRVNWTSRGNCKTKDLQRHTKFTWNSWDMK